MTDFKPFDGLVEYLDVGDRIELNNIEYVVTSKPKYHAQYIDAPLPLSYIGETLKSAVIPNTIKIRCRFRAKICVDRYTDLREWSVVFGQGY